MHLNENFNTALKFVTLPTGFHENLLLRYLITVACDVLIVYYIC